MRDAVGDVLRQPFLGGLAAQPIRPDGADIGKGQLVQRGGDFGGQALIVALHFGARGHHAHRCSRAGGEFQPGDIDGEGRSGAGQLHGCRPDRQRAACHADLPAAQLGGQREIGEIQGRADAGCGR